MKRREFITLLGGAAAGWPLGARAQQRAVPVVGLLGGGLQDSEDFRLAGFRKGLTDTGFAEGRNVAIEYRWADNQAERLPALAADLVRRRVAVMVASGGVPAVAAAKAASTTIPIVFMIGGDPVRFRLVDSLNRPGGNVTGVSFFTATALVPKQLELLHEMVPKAVAIGFLVNPNNPNSEMQSKDLQDAVRSLGLQTVVLPVGSESDIAPAFATLASRRVEALFISGDALFTRRRDQLIALAARHGIPAMYPYREFAAVGGLISYGTSIEGAYRQAGIYTGRILKGAKPAELPVVLPTRFDLVINLKTARALGLAVPEKLLALANDVIE